MADDDDQRARGREARRADRPDQTPGEAVGAARSPEPTPSRRSEGGRGVVLARPREVRDPRRDRRVRPVAATSTLSIAWLPYCSVLASHHSASGCGGRVVAACAAVSSHAPRSVWACRPFTPASAIAADRRRERRAAATRARERRFPAATEIEAQAEPDHRRARSSEVTLPSRTTTSRSA